MPTPLEILLHPLSFPIYFVYAAILVWEAVAPAKKLPHVPYWRVVGLCWFFTYFLVSTYLPLLWDGLLAEYRLFDLTGLGVFGGTVVGLLVYECAAYAWHQTMHGSDGLFLGIHQMHHSAERLDAWGAFFFSPVGMVAWTLVSSLSLTLVVGILPGSATAIVLIVTSLAMFQHANVRTPRWLGYFVQRPESHSLHHERGVHSRNYADLPVLDMLFGTFANPREHAERTGFYDGASSRIAEMLVLQDVSTASTRGDRGTRAGLRSSPELENV